MTVRRLLVVVFVAVIVAIAFASYLERGSDCVSDGRGVRGEATRGKDGRLLYFNGECWTHEPVAPTDTPF
jgi:hypothetical protein